MKIPYLKCIILILGVGLTTMVMGQRNNPTISLQIGYNAKFINSKPYNFAIDQYNSLNNLSVNLKPAKWGSGFSAGIGYHRGRSNIRLNAMLYGASSYAVGIDSTSGETFRRDVSLNGAVISLGLMSELIKLYRDGHFLVGASINFMNFNTETLLVPEANYEKDTPLTDVSNDWKTSFTIIAPFRFGITPQFKISLEPYYQIFFSQVNLRDFSTAINGSLVNPGLPELASEPDHFGVNLSLIFMLKRG
ncbi:MAG: hypothetical protein KDE26_06185 [Bacteroidetes bacterium]|nr:hypothetical protein [Bacteroidota bacterium]